MQTTYAVVRMLCAESAGYAPPSFQESLVSEEVLERIMRRRSDRLAQGGFSDAEINEYLGCRGLGTSTGGGAP